MKREKLLRSKEYIVSQLQLGLLNLIGEFKRKKNLKDYELAKELGVSKGYVSQLLNVTFDHKISKVVELALACNSMPLLYFVDLDKYIEDDSRELAYELMPVLRPLDMTYTFESELETDYDNKPYKPIPFISIKRTENELELS
jgi:transcriptional regulator with XRE-family HTH domain